MSSLNNLVLGSEITTPAIHTLGCRLNIAESETIRGLLAGRDVTVVNTCAVTNEAVKQSRAAIRRARRDRPDARLVVTGCAARIDPAGFAAMTEVDRVVDNDDKLDPAAWADNRASAPRPAPVVAFASHARAFVGVQTGCDHSCTFCAIPAGRGASRSTPIAAAVARVAALVYAGHNEVVLTGVDLTSFTPSLGELVEVILREVPALPRLRLSSLDSIEIDERLFELVTQEARVAPHLHLSLQHGDNLILKRMKRRHSRAQAVALVQRLKTARPDIAIGADLIAGFPTEDAAAHANSLALIDDCAIVHAHVFPYSPRENTPAARMPQVEPALRRERAERLRERAAAGKAAWLRSLIGTAQDVVIENPGDRGHAGNFAEVRLPLHVRAERVEAPTFSSEVKNGSFSTSAGQTGVGKLMKVHITAATPTHLIGRPA